MDAIKMKHINKHLRVFPNQCLMSFLVMVIVMVIVMMTVMVMVMVMMCARVQKGGGRVQATISERESRAACV